MSPSKIAMIVSGFPRHSETFALNELHALEAYGLLAKIFATKAGDSLSLQPGSEHLLKHVHILPVGSPAEQAAAVIAQLGGRAITGVHAYFAHAPAEVASQVAQRLGVPYGFSVHARDARKVPAPELADRARRAACVIACNPDTAAEIRKSGVEVHVIPHGVDIHRFHPRPLPPSEPLPLLAVGRLVEKKGVDILIDAVARLPFPFRLRIVGDGPERRRLAAAIAAAGLTECVKLCGRMTHEELPEEYARAHIVVVPSTTDRTGDRDGLPNVVLEAMASGRPVVASDIAAIPSAIAHGSNGLLVPPGDAAALASALDTLARQPTVRHAYGHKARTRAERDFELRSCTERLRYLLETTYASTDKRMPVPPDVPLRGAYRVSLPSSPQHEPHPTHPASDTVRPKKKIAYLLKMFPRFSETFILNEILELERQNIPLSLFSLKHPKESFRQAPVATVKSKLTYVPEPIKLTPFMLVRHIRVMWPVLKANIRIYKKYPKRYREVLRLCLAARDRKTTKRFLAAGYIANILIEERVQHLHAHFANDPTTVARFVHLLTGIPYSFTAHAKDIHLSKEDALREHIHAANFVVTCSEYNRAHLSTLSTNNTPIHTIYHGLDWNLFFNGNEPKWASRASCPSNGLPTILSVGRLVEKKGFDQLIQACNLLANWRVDFRCEIVGEGPLQSYLDKIIHDLSLQTRVYILRFLPQEELIHKYAEADVFALPSRISENGDRDGIPNVLVEALAMSLPVVTTPVAGIAELVEPSRTGILVPPNDPLALARALREILLEPSAYRHLGRIGQARVKQNFDLTSNVARLRDCFQRD